MNTQKQTTMTFGNKEKITIIRVSGAAITLRTTMTVKGKNEQGWYGSYGKERKCYHLPKDALIFRGTKIPYIVDSDTNSFVGNACINFLSNDHPETIRQWLKTNNINPQFTDWDKIQLASLDQKGTEREYQPLFTENPFIAVYVNPNNLITQYPIKTYKNLSRRLGYDYFTLAPTPYDEECTPAGKQLEHSKMESSIYIDQLIRLYGTPPQDASFFIMENDHEAGIYYEAAIQYECPVEEENEEEEKENPGMEYALKVEPGCANWDEPALTQLRAAGHHLHQPDNKNKLRVA